MPETGPIFGKPLINTLPVGGMMMDLPDKQELDDCAKYSMRLVHGYEILLHYYLQACDALVELRDHQNGCPLPSYQDGWDKAMAKADTVIDVFNRIEPKQC